jgi:hypothetical protein
VRRTLIVCPASLKQQWVRAIHQFTGAEEIRVMAGPREAQQASYGDAPPVLVTSYAQSDAAEGLHTASRPGVIRAALPGRRAGPQGGRAALPNEPSAQAGGTQREAVG